MSGFKLDMRALLRQPLLHFLVAGAAIFALDAVRGTPDSANDKRIVVTTAHIERLADQWRMTWGRQPDDLEIQALVRNYIKEEIYYREAIKLGLDVNDSVIRQRLGRKIEFLMVPELTVDDLDDDALTDYFNQHAERYRLSPVMSIEQVYFSSERSANAEKDDSPAAVDEVTSKGRINDALGLLSKGISAEKLGDVIGLPKSLNSADKASITRSFGAEFFEALLLVEEGVWSGPVKSGFGQHLVKITDKRVARLPQLSEVRGSVVNDWLAEQNVALQNKAYEQLRSGYDVRIDVSSE